MGKWWAKRSMPKPPLKCSSHHEKRAGGYQTFGIPFMVFMDLSQAQTILGIYENSGSFDVTVALESCVGLKHIRRTLTPLEDTLRIEMCSPLLTPDIHPTFQDTCCHKVSEATCHVQNLEKGIVLPPILSVNTMQSLLFGWPHEANERTWYGSTNKPQGSRDSASVLPFHFLPFLQGPMAQLHPSSRRVCVTSATSPMFIGFGPTGHPLWHLDGRAEFDERISYCCQKLYQRHFSHALRNESPIKKSTTWWLGTLTIATKRLPYGFCYMLFSSAHIQQYLKIYRPGRNWHHEIRCHPYHGQP